jgi:inositol-hexakisphosphate 5-kinase
MPDSLPRPEAAGPSFPVKRLPLGHDKNNVISPSSPTWAGSIMATRYGVPFTQSNNQDLTYFARRASTLGEHSPLLSERESIFATHYIPVENDSSTPRLLPHLAGAVAEPSAPETLEPNMEFSLPPLVATPSKLSIRSSLTAARSGSGRIAGGLKQYGPTGSRKSADRQIPASKSMTHGIRRVASDVHPPAKSFHVYGGHSTQLHGIDQPQATLYEPAAMEDDTAPMEANAVQKKEEQDHAHGQGAQRHSAMSQAMRPTRSERSVSRGRTHVDNSIEATLTNAEPGQNIRSRKSSHLMGVFRENTSVESRQRETNVPHTEEADHAQTISRPSMPSGRTPSRSTSATISEAIPAQPDSLPQEGAPSEQHQSFAFIPDQELDNEFPSSQFSTIPKVPQSPPAQPKSPSKHEHDPYFRKQDAIKQSKGSRVPPIPPSLLEQIREHHNLVPMRGQGEHLPKDRTGFTSHEDSNVTDRRHLRAGDIGGQTDENEEHISSAVYFPHPVPVEDLEQFSSPEAGPLITSDQAEIGAPVPGGVQNHIDVKRPSMDLAPPEHIDISVQSKHEKRVFHGDYQPADEAQYEEVDRDLLPTIKERPSESHTIASDSEVESSEDIGATSQTDDGDITPTPTPIPTSQLRREKRPSISTGPRGAVLLEPYSHQVGGHSTIFRFSRRAVCKQLNNRENEFYERIERRHPDMLRFLPRFVLLLSLLPLPCPKM